MYGRDGELLTCELGPAHDLVAYELRLSPSHLATGPASEVFDDAMSAVQRQTLLEQELIDEGWRLEDFQKDRTLF